jgi:glycosyltransferase involved in cell wall biosynthesis
VNYGLARRLRQGRFDALWVHGYAPWYNQLALATAKAMGIITLVRDDVSALSKQRSAFKTALKRQTFFRFLNVVTDGFLAIGTWNRAYYEANGIPSERIFTAPYCVDNGYFRARAEAAAPHRESFRASLGLQPGRPVILYASKLQRRKKPDELLSAHLSLDGPVRPYLLFVGDGEMRSELEAAADESVLFLGFRNQSELPAFFDLCDIFVLPSVEEPWALIVNEVMCAGKPVVVSDQVGCWPDLVQDGINGFVFPAGDVVALADCLAALVSDGARRVEMGAAGRKIIESWGIPEATDVLRIALASLARR